MAGGRTLLARRQLGASWGATLSLVVVALLAALVLSTAPRAVDGMHSRQTAYATQSVSHLARDVAGNVDNTLPGTYPGMGQEQTEGDPEPPTAPDWETFQANLAAWRDAQPEPLRSLLGEPAFQVTSATGETVAPVPGSDLTSVTLSFRAAPDLRENAALVAGRWPEATVVPQWQLDETTGITAVSSAPFEVAVSRAVAERFGWQVGGEYPLPQVISPTSTRMGQRAQDGFGPLVVAGIFEAVEPGSSFWAHNPGVVEPYVPFDPNTGYNATATVYVDPAMMAALNARRPPETHLWIPLSGDRLTAAEAPEVLAQLRALGARAVTVDAPIATDPANPFQFPPEFEHVTFTPSSELTEVLDTLLAQRSGVDAIVAVLAAGPVGATLAVLALGARLVVDRRRSALTLLRARGASGFQLRALMAAEGLVLGLAAAVLGLGLGLVLVPGQVTATQIGLALVAGLAPAAALALATSPRDLRVQRSDLAPRSGSRVRWIGETLVYTSAVVSTSLLVSRGVVSGTSSGSTGVDPLLALAPLLLALAATLAAVRLYPLGALAVERALAPRRDLVPFLGAARATRDPAGGPVPALALVLAVAVAATSTVLYSTVSGGVVRESWRAVGADLRISGPIIGEEVLGLLGQVDGVEAVSPVSDLGQLPLRSGLAGERVDVYAVDAAALATVQTEVDGSPTTLAGLASGGGSLTAIAGSGGAAATLYAGIGGYELVGKTAVPLDVLESVAEVPGITSRSILLVDASRAAELLGTSAAPRLALASLDEGADPAAVAAAVREVLPTAVVDDPSQRADQILASPVSSGLSAAFLLAVLLGGLLCGVAVVMTLMLAGPVRARLLAVLQTLGLSGRQGRGLVGWEIGPWTVVALVVGALLGAVVPRVVLAAVDVTALTGGDDQPDARFDPALLAAVAGGFVVVVLLAVLVAAALGRRGEIAAQLRIGEER